VERLPRLWIGDELGVEEGAGVEDSRSRRSRSGDMMDSQKAGLNRQTVWNKRELGYAVWVSRDGSYGRKRHERGSMYDQVGLDLVCYDMIWYG
jgi:hypothetical protein